MASGPKAGYGANSAQAKAAIKKGGNQAGGRRRGPPAPPMGGGKFAAKGKH